MITPEAIAAQDGNVLQMLYKYVLSDRFLGVHENPQESCVPSMWQSCHEH
jgi:hypothetical protein